MRRRSRMEHCSSTTEFSISADEWVYTARSVGLYRPVRADESGSNTNYSAPGGLGGTFPLNVKVRGRRPTGEWAKRLPAFGVDLSVTSEAKRV
jgi:hypothetical protein